MTAIIPTLTPASFMAGNTVKWTMSLPDYLPADGWVLSYAFVVGGDQQLVTATDNGDGSHLVTLAAADSAKFVAGIYHWQAYVTSGAERFPVGQSRVEVKPNYADMNGGHDSRSNARQVLDALDAMMLKKASKDQQSYTMPNGIAVARLAPGDIIVWRDYYRRELRQELQAERLANGQSLSNKVVTRFTS